MNIVVTALGIALALAIILFARKHTGYRHVRHTISELGERGVPCARIVSFGLFLPVGLCLAWIALASRTSAPAAAALAAVIAIGYGVAAFFPCDPGSPLHGSFSQGIHNLAGGVQYIGGTVALLRLGQENTVFNAFAGVVAVMTLLLSVPQFPWRGFAQRIAEIALFSSLALAI